MNCFQHLHSSDQGAVICKYTRNSPTSLSCATCLCHVLRSSAVKFDRVGIAFILVLFQWWKWLTDERGEEAGVHGETDDELQEIVPTSGNSTYFRKYYLLQ